MEDSGPTPELLSLPSPLSPRSRPAPLLQQSRRRLGSVSKERALRDRVPAEPPGGRESERYADEVCDDGVSSRTSLRSSLAMIGEETRLRTSSHSERQNRSATPILASQKQNASSPSRLARARRAAVPTLTPAADTPRHRKSGESGTSSPTSPSSPTPIADRALEKSELLLRKLSVSLGLGDVPPLVEIECSGVCSPRSECRAMPLEACLSEPAPPLRAASLPTAPIDTDISFVAESWHTNADVSPSTAASWQVTAAMARGLSELQTRVSEIERAGLPLKGRTASFSPEDLFQSLAKQPLSPTSTKSPGSMSTCFSWCSTPRAASPRAATPVPSRVVRLASAPRQALDLAAPPSPPMARAVQRPQASPWQRVQVGPQPRTPRPGSQQPRTPRPAGPQQARTPRPRSPTLLRHSVAVTSVYHWYSVSS